jgi:HlyD family secretion protein
MNRKLIPALVAAVAAVGGAAWYLWPRPTDPVLRLHGTVETQEVRVGSKTGGRLVAVEVREGQAVSPGQVLVRFEADELIARRDQAKSRAEAARAAWAKATKGPLDEEIAEAKAAADAGQARLALAVAGFRDERKRQAQADLAAAAAELKRAEDEYTRVAGLRTASDSEREQALAGRDRARGLHASAKATAEMMAAGNRPQEVDEARADLARLTARYDLLRRGTRDEDKAVAYAALTEAEAKLSEAETLLREAVVTAPDRAVVEVVAVRAGDLVPAGQPVVRLLRADDLWVKVFVPSTELGKVKLGRAVGVEVDAYPGRRFPGTVTFIASVSEFTPRNVQSVDERRHQVFAVKVSVADPEGVFKSGMAAEVFLDVSEGR